MNDKYTKEELKEMSLSFLYADGGGDSLQDQMKADLLLQRMQQITGLNREQIRYYVRQLAK